MNPLLKDTISIPTSQTTKSGLMNLHNKKSSNLDIKI